MAKDALKRNYSGLFCRDEPMQLGGSSISLRFEWPGYKSWSRQIKTQDWTGSRKPITGAKLVTEVAKVLERFIKAVQDQPIDLTEREWQVGPVGTSFISFDDVAILSLQRVSKGSWQVVFGRMS